MAVNRVTGLSNFDVEGMVKKLMDAETVKLTKVQQNKQYRVWEQEAYRSVSDQLAAFKNEYFDTLKPESNFRSSSLFAKFTTSVTVNGTASTKISVKANADIQNFDQQIDSITKLAQKDKYESAALGFDAILSKDLAADFATGKPANFKATLTIGSVSKTVEVDMAAVNNLTDFSTAFNNEIVAEFGANYSGITSVSGNQLKIRSAGNNVSLVQQTGSESSLTWLGVASGTSSQAYQSKTLNELLGLTGADLSAMKIGSKSLSDIGVLTTDSVSKMLQKVNSAGLSATMSYDSLSDKFSLTATKEGLANQMTLSAELKSKLKLDGGVHTAGEDAVLRMNGVDLIKSENTFTVNGVTVTLNATHNAADGPIKMNFKVDTDKIVDKIKSFVEVYNGLITSTYGKLTEKVYRSYTPLTEEQKKEMTDEQIKLWEDKSKSGVLRNHADIEAIAVKMRRALSDAVEGSGITLAQLGITTSANYKENGKLIINDEAKLRKGIESNFTDVVRLFSNESDKAYLENGTTAERYRENGLGNRLNDILQDAIRTSRDASGKKGTLVEAAGLKNDLSSITSSLSQKISEYDDRIATLLESLTLKEKDYYAMFSRVESALSKMESQGSYLSSQLK